MSTIKTDGRRKIIEPPVRLPEEAVPTDTAQFRNAVESESRPLPQPIPPIDAETPRWVPGWKPEPPVRIPELPDTAPKPTPPRRVPEPQPIPPIDAETPRWAPGWKPEPEPPRRVPPAQEPPRGEVKYPKWEELLQERARRLFGQSESPPYMVPFITGRWRVRPLPA